MIAAAEDPEDEAVTLVLGPDRAGNLMEIGVLATPDGAVIIHAMPARPRRFGQGD